MPLGLNRREVVLVAAVVLINVVVIIAENTRAFMTLGLVNGLVPVVIRWLREWQHKVKTLEGFGWTWRVTVIYGSLLMYISLQFGNMIGGVFLGAIVVAITGAGPELTVALINLASTLSIVFLGIPLLYLAGRVMGRRMTPSSSLSQGITAIGIAGSLAVVASVATTAVAADPTLFASMWEPLVAGSWSTALQMVVGMLVILVPAWIGYYRGRRQRLGAYMAYVLNRMTADTRKTIVALAYQEAVKGGA